MNLLKKWREARRASKRLRVLEVQVSRLRRLKAARQAA